MIVVATQKDIYLASEADIRRKQLRKEGRKYDEDLENECEKYARDRLPEQVKQIEEEMWRVMTGPSQMKLCVPVSEGASLPALLRIFADYCIG